MKTKGFSPYLSDGTILVLGSFPSVKSREVSFYYGNRQNNFWRVLSKAFSLPLPETTEEKKRLLDRCGVSLWDIVTACEIVGSMDKDIRDPEIADLPALIKDHPFEKILCNGARSYELTTKFFPELSPLVKKMPSTSPANGRFDEVVWLKELKTDP